MAPRKRSAPSRQRPLEYRFWIDAYTRETFPLDRLAAYLGELATLLGDATSVHLDRVEDGSAVPVLRIDHEAQPKVRDRLQAVRQKNGPPDAQRSFNRIDEMLRQDNARANLKVGARRTNVLVFPGREARAPRVLQVVQPSSVQGQIVRVGGVDETIPVHLKVEGRVLTGCQADHSIARSLGALLFQQVRLHGQGTWRRSPEGVWELETFRVQSFEKLDDASLETVVSELRGAPVTWLPDPDSPGETARR